MFLMNFNTPGLLCRNWCTWWDCTWWHCL